MKVETKGEKFKHWIQDNLQAIIIIFIAFIILFFLIYSYSKKANNDNVIIDDTAQGEVIDEIDDVNGQIDAGSTDTTGNDSQSGNVKVVVIKPGQNDEDLKNNQDGEENQGGENGQDSQNDTVSQIGQEKGPSSTTSINHSPQESKSGVITVTAVYGDGLTHLARKATSQYISENGITDLTSAHKIYIEDYLQKSVQAGTITPGTSVDFSNNLIAEAVNSAQALSSAELQNLNNYAGYVSYL